MGSRSGGSRAPPATLPVAPMDRQRCGWLDAADASQCGCASCLARRSASTTARTAWPTAIRPCSVPRWTMSPPTGRWVSVDREQQLVRGRVTDLAGIAYLAAALGVERRLVQHQLGGRAGVDPQLDLGARLQLLVARRVTHDGHDPSLGGRALVAHETGIAGRAGHVVVQRRGACVARQVRLAARARPLTLLLECRIEARVGRPARRTRPPARRSGRWGSHRCRAAERPRRRRAPEHRPGSVSASRPIDRSAPVNGMSASSRWMVPASRVRAKAVSSRRMAPRTSVRRSRRMGYASPIDSMTTVAVSTRNGVAAAQQPAMAHCPADDAPQHVAAALVGRQYPVRDEEGDGPGVVGDDLVAEALRFEGVRVVAQQLQQPRVEWREQVGVVVAADTLDHRGEALQAHAGVDALEWQRHPLAGRPLVELHEHQVPDFQPARTVLAVIGDALRALGQVCATVVVDSRCTGRRVRCPPCARSWRRHRYRRRPSGPCARVAGRSRHARSPTLRHRRCMWWRPAVPGRYPGRGSGSPTPNGWRPA